MTVHSARKPHLRGAVWRDQDGASAVEFSITGSLAIALVLGVIQLGWALQIRNDISQAADQAARFVMLTPEASDSALEAKVYSALTEYDAERIDVEIGEMTVGSAEFRTLSVEYGLAVTIPGFPLNAITLSQSRRIPVLE